MTVFSDKNKTINHIKSECSKLALREYKTRHGQMRKMIHWELYKKMKFDHTTKWYMHKPESIQENETYISLAFCNTMDHLIPATRQDLVLINKKNGISAVFRIFRFLRTTEWKSKKMNRDTSICTLQEN